MTMTTESRSIRATIQNTLVRGLALSAVLVAVFVAALAVIHLNVTQERAKQLLLAEVESLSVAGVLNQDVLSVEREANRFLGSWVETQPVSAEVEVRLDGRLIAKAGDIPGWRRLDTRISRDLTLANHSKLGVSIILNSSSYWKRICAYLCAGEFAVAVLFLLLGVSLHRSAERIVSPLSLTVDWVERVTSNLPDSLLVQGPKVHAGVKEVGTLNASIQALLTSISTLQANLTRTEVDRARVEVAEQVGHDLKSLLATIELRLGQMSEFPADRRVAIQDSLVRIRGVIDSLKRKRNTQPGGGPAPLSADTRSANLDREPVMLAPLIERIVSEKRDLVSASRKSTLVRAVVKNAELLSARVDEVEFQRALSNLLDNALEALSEDGTVEVRMVESENCVEISVVDNGCGIAEDRLERITKRGESFGKEGGSGLGLYYARSCAEAWGGTLSIGSRVGEGTTVSFRIPATHLSWAPRHIDGSGDRYVVVLDDDKLVHLLWKQRLAESGAEATFTFLSDVQDLDSEMFDQDHVSRTTYLVDYDLGETSPNGLDIIEKHGIAEHSILVSGNFDRPDVVERARRLGVRRMSKDWIGIIPVVVRGGGSKANGKPIRRGSGIAAEVKNRPARAVSVEV